MKKLTLQTNFTAGELSPLLHAFLDMNKYKNGLATAQNCLIRPQGPISKRTGSQYIATAKHAGTNIIRLMRFQFSQQNAYILEFGLNYVRFFKNALPVLNTGVPYEVTTPYSDTDVFGLSYAQFGNTIYIAHGNYPTSTLTWTSDTNWLFQPAVFFPIITDQFGFNPHHGLTLGATSGNNITVTAGASSFLQGDTGRNIVEVDSTGSILENAGRASIITVSSATVAIVNILQTFSSTSLTSGLWTMDLSPYASLQPNGTVQGTTCLVRSIAPGSGGNITPTGNLTINGTTGSQTFTSDQAGTFSAVNIGQIIVNLIGTGRAIITSITSGVSAVATITETWQNMITVPETDWGIQVPIDTFRSTDVGRYIVLQNGIGLITAVNSTSEVQVNIQKAFNSTAATTAWSIEDAAWTSANGYPAIVAFDQQRLLLASWKTKPQTVVFSASGIFNNMGVGASDSDAVEVDVSTNFVNQVNWALPIRTDMLLGTSGTELSLNGNGSPITPTNIEQETRSYYGSNAQVPIGLGVEGLYFHRSGRKIMSIRYDFLTDTYVSDDLTFFAEHITEGIVKEMAWAFNPNRVIYAVLNDGTMIAGTYYKEQQIIGWTRFVTQGNYESVQTISTGQYDEVWVCVNRTINGTSTRYIERFCTGDGTLNTDGFSDSYSIYNNPLTITGISNALTAVITIPNHGYANGTHIKILGAQGLTDNNNKNYINGITFIVFGATTNTFSLTNLAGTTLNTATLTAYTGSGTANQLVTNISGLTYLNGTTVKVLTDGATHPDCVVSGGSITLDYPAYAVVVGLGYDFMVQTLNLVYDLGAGMQQGQQVRFVRPILRVVDSVLPTLNGQYQPSRSPQDPTDNSVPLFTGDVIYHGLPFDSAGQLTIESSDPLPLTLLGIFGSFSGGTQ